MRLPGIPEEVEQVRDFAELQPGHLVWFLNCTDCKAGAKHRLFIVRIETKEMFSLQRGLVSDLAADCEPMPPCGLGGFSTLAVTNGNVYRVVDPKMDAQPATTERARKLVRP